MYLNVNISGKVAIVAINSPATLNALSTCILKELDDFFDSIMQRPGVNIIIITGAGRSFVAGADISEMRDMTAPRAKEYAMHGASLFKKIETLNKVTIAAINGFALGGGCELAMACDIRIASEKAKFGQPEVGLGIIPGFSGVRRMIDIIGEAKAKEYIFSGRILDAFEAEKIGLVNKVVSSDILMDECQKMAAEIANKSFNAVITSKRVMNAMKGDLDYAIKMQSDYFADCFSHPDQKTGMNAFVNKEKPFF